MFIVESQENTDQSNSFDSFFSTLSKGMNVFCYIHKNIVFLMRTYNSGVISGILFKDCSGLVNYTIMSSV